MEFDPVLEVVGEDVFVGVGEVHVVDIGAVEGPVSAGGAGEEGIDAAGADADVDAGDGAGWVVSVVEGGARGIDEGLHPADVFVTVMYLLVRVLFLKRVVGFHSPDGDL